jgi:hypothetical protein
MDVMSANFGCRVSIAGDSGSERRGKELPQARSDELRECFCVSNFFVF